eukprot:g2678.t1
MPKILIGDVVKGDTILLSAKKSLIVTAIKTKENMRTGQLMVRFTGIDDKNFRRTISAKDAAKEVTLIARGANSDGEGGEDVFTESESEDELTGLSHTQYWEKTEVKLKERGEVGEDGLTNGERAAKHIDEMGDHLNNEVQLRNFKL